MQEEVAAMRSVTTSTEDKPAVQDLSRYSGDGRCDELERASISSIPNESSQMCLYQSTTTKTSEI